MDFFNTTVTPTAIENAIKTLRSGFLSEGARVKEFEQALSSKLGLRNPICVNSGTSALHLALIAAGVEAGDEVILPPQTFIASALAILYCGAIPVFADVDPLTGNISPKSIKNRISKKTAAIMIVDWAGYPASDIAIDEQGGDFIPIIEDAAHALGAICRGEPVGRNTADFTCFSFQSIKHLAVGDGGAVCAWRYGHAKQVQKLRWFGIDRDCDLPDALGERQYILNKVGYKYNMTDIDASIGLGNLDGFQDRLMRRVNNAKTYDSYFRDVPGLTLPAYKTDRLSSYWLYPILVDGRDKFVEMMRAADIPVSVVHRRIDRHPLFGGINGYLTGAAYFDTHQINLPVHDGLTERDLNVVIKAVKGGW